ncbi:MAG: hypothetical protein IJ346_04015 [Clostridia bacterium]|nr:hypothetical protein [Clostridia bacterium]
MNDNEFLNLISKNAEMGKVGIDSIMEYTRDEKMREALRVQAKEYDKIYAEAGQMLKERNAEVKHLNPMAKIGSEMTSAMKTMTDHSTAKIAEMMIQGSTMGVTKLMKNRADYDGNDKDILSLSDKLLSTEERNIKTMKGFF